ncbi:Stalked cell differentiation-controlling protein [Thiorhodovibrio winogradskyi]|uniref:diguanylate cyclase n=2 Tax=Thiorhodovibrio winogradskyi TaxID=77007 RepID=A0ABZ0S4F3_9GAMM
MSFENVCPNSDGLLVAVARSLADPIFVIDETGRYRHVLGGAARQYYDSSEYLIGRRMHEVLPREIADQFLAVIRRALADNEVQTLEYRLSSLLCDGNRRDGPSEDQWFEGRVSPIESLPDADARAVAWVVINITQRKQLEAELERLAVTDELTGMLNRRAFIETADAAIARALRFGHPLQLALMDLDHFKRINDDLGHPVGDQVLRHVSKLLKERVRSTDVLGRIGGEEFALCMPDSHPGDAQVLVNDIREILRGQPADVDLGNGGRRKLPVTFSAGISSLASEDSNTIDLFIRADKCLYRAKHEGRDCVRGPG